MTTNVHTNDIGIAIRDGLDLLDGIEIFDWDSDDCDSTGLAAFISAVDASDASNLIVNTANGATFRVSITRIEAPRGWSVAGGPTDALALDEESEANADASYAVDMEA